MANSRVIRHNFYNNPEIASRYSIEERYFLIGLVCASNDWGLFWWNSSNIKSVIYPTDNKQNKWIEKTLDKFLNDGFLCKYESNNQWYGHFIKWFDKGFCLKQRLDHPKESDIPDCKHHLMTIKKTRKKRETSPTIKENIIKPNIKEYKESVNDDISSLTQSFLDSLKSKYPTLNLSFIKEKYILYYKSNPKDIKCHQSNFETWCIRERKDSNDEKVVNPEEELKKLELYNRRNGTNYESVEELREATDKC